MWICMNTGFLSIVESSEDPSVFLVRARVRKHLATFLRGIDAKITISPHNDYRFRAILPKRVVASRLHELMLDIDYPNFKDSVKDKELHDMYALWWSDHHQMQTKAEAPKDATEAKQEWSNLVTHVPGAKVIGKLGTPPKKK